MSENYSIAQSAIKDLDINSINAPNSFFYTENSGISSQYYL